MTDDDALLIGQYRALADDLRRWAKSFDDERAGAIVQQLAALAASLEHQADALLGGTPEMTDDDPRQDVSNEHGEVYTIGPNGQRQLIAVSRRGDDPGEDTKTFID